MRLEGYLRANAFLQIEQPPLLWEIDVEDEPFVRLLGELIALGLGRGNELAELTLNVANVTVPPEAAGEPTPPAGDFVALTIRGQGDWGPETTAGPEFPERGQGVGLLRCLGPEFMSARAAWAYTRDLGDRGSLTVFLPRLAG